jgi:hypothetical protein
MTENKIIAPQTKQEILTLKEIETALSRPIPQSMLKKLKDKGNCDYVPWYTAVKILNKYCLGWRKEIKSITTTPDRIFITVALTIPTSDFGEVTREATGTETLKMILKSGEVKEHSYGDPSSNAESMAFRRAAAQFGLALYLYEK